MHDIFPTALHGLEYAGVQRVTLYEVLSNSYDTPHSP
jgi:hypothetical protein